MSPRSRLRVLFDAGLAAGLVALAGDARADSPSWATTQAAELTRQGQDHAKLGDAQTATKRFLEAISFDGTYGPAYLALGTLDEATGDVGEAERAYSLGIDHVTGFAEGLIARGRLRAKLHRVDAATADFEAAVALRDDDAAILQELANAYVRASAFPAALAVTRRIVVLAEEHRDAKAAADARVAARALAILVGDVDPVAAGRSNRGAVRNALASLGSRGSSK